MGVNKLKDNEPFEIAMEKAKRKVMSCYGCTDYYTNDRRWKQVYVDSYNIPDYRIALIVWTGSPAKGYIVINYGRGVIRAFGVDDKCIGVFNFREQIKYEYLE